MLDAYPFVGDQYEVLKVDGGGEFVTTSCPLRCHSSATVRWWCGSSGALCLKCWARCDSLEILRARNLGWQNCYPADTDWKQVQRTITARYPYYDKLNRFKYECCRMEPGFGGKDKTFFQRRPDGRGSWINSIKEIELYLYRLPQLLDSDPNEIVFLTAGEKDCDTLRALNLLSTTNVGGESKGWLESYSDTLADRDVVIIQDNDGTGRRHANEVAGALMTTARSVRRVCLPQKDATAFVNHLRAHEGVTDKDAIRDRLWAVCEQYPKWEASM